MTQLKDPAEEIKRLQRCINDLVSVLALPAAWSGREPSEVVYSLQDALLRLLQLDFVFVRVNGADGGAPIELVRAAPTLQPAPQLSEIGQILHQQWGDDPLQWSSGVRCPFRGQEISLLPLQLGLHAEIGVMVAGSERADFPEETEKLVLSVAANQGAIGLREAQLRSDQKRIADELDQRVAQKTMELAQANKELRKEISERRLVEKRLRQEETELKHSEARKTAILNSALDCIVTIDHKGCITEFNPAAESTFGFHRNEVIGREMATVIVPPSLREQHRQGLARYLTTGESRVLGRRIEMTAVRADGTEIPVELAISHIPFDGPPSFTGYMRDITERKRRDDALREAHERATQSEERWRSVFENSAVGVALTDLNGRFLTTNPVYQQMLGYTEQELQTLSFLDITHEEDVARNGALVGELLSGRRREFLIEKRYRRKDGSLVWVRSNVSLVQGTERVPGFLTAIVEDISERKRAEDKLRRSEAFLAEAQHLSQIGSYSWRVATNEVTWSEQLYRIYEIEIGVPVTLELVRTRVHPEDLTLYEKMVEHARSGGNDFEWQYRLMMPDHSIKYLHAVAHATRDQEGQLEYLAAIQDVTARRRSEEALDKARSQLANVTRATSLGVLTASITHEINQPLSGIVTNASTCLRMLGSDPPNVDGARETARRTIRDGNRASEVMTRLRALFTQKTVSTDLLDLNEATQEVVAVSLGELRINQVILRQELADDLPQVRGDRVQLQQVILNLVRNASDAMRTIVDRPRQLLIRTERDEGDRVRLSVKDTGVGFEPQAAERLFEAFYTTKSDGMGIGLSVSRSIIERHQGHLWARLNDGPGATFSFSIPGRLQT